MEYTFTSENFQKEVLESGVPVMIDFYADWCGPCKMMAPAVSQLADKFQGEIKVGRLNVDENPDLAQKYGIMSIPNFVFLKNGQVVDQAVGAMPPAMLEEKLNKLR